MSCSCRQEQNSAFFIVYLLSCAVELCCCLTSDIIPKVYMKLLLLMDFILALYFSTLLSYKCSKQMIIISLRFVVFPSPSSELFVLLELFIIFYLSHPFE